MRGSRRASRPLASSPVGCSRASSDAVRWRAGDPAPGSWVTAFTPKLSDVSGRNFKGSTREKDAIAPNWASRRDSSGLAFKLHSPIRQANTPREARWGANDARERGHYEEP